MLKLITWNQYGLFVGVTLFAWYAYVLLRHTFLGPSKHTDSFSPTDRTGLFASVDNDPFEKRPKIRDIADKQPSPSANANDLRLITQTVTQEIISVLAEAAQGDFNEAELFARLQVILSNYPNLKNTAHGIAVNDLIVHEGKAMGFTLSKEDVRKCWD